MAKIVQIVGERQVTLFSLLDRMLQRLYLRQTVHGELMSCLKVLILFWEPLFP